MIKALSHIAVHVTDMDKSLEFYCEVLGLPEQFRLTRDDGEVWLLYLKVAQRQFIELRWKSPRGGCGIRDGAYHRR